MTQNSVSLRLAATHLQDARDEIITTANSTAADWRLAYVETSLARALSYLGYRLVPLTQDKPELARNQPCGCVVCICEDEEQCHGCGAKHCGTHPVGKIPNPVYATQDKPDSGRPSIPETEVLSSDTGSEFIGG